MPKQVASSLDTLLGSFISTALTTSSGNNEVMPVVEFAEEIVFNGEVKLFPQQSALLKAFYGEPLDDKEIHILSSWVHEDKSTWVEGRQYKNLALEVGRGGSKSSTASIIALKEFYDLITLPNPARHYGLLPNDPIAIFVIAQTLEQVKDTLFGKIKGYAQDSDFFKSMEDAGKIEILAETIRCPSKNVAIYAKHTNSPALVGYTIKCMILDEFARFENKQEIDGTINSMGDELWDNVGKGTNRFGRLGRKVAISSAWCINDPMERIREIAKKDPETLAFQLKTWDLNKLPTVSREACNSDYIKDRIKAELEYECVRRRVGSGFINGELVDKYSTGISAVDVQTGIEDVTSGGSTRHYVKLDVLRVKEGTDAGSFIHVDFSVKRDSTALALCHPIRFDDDRWGVQVDATMMWVPFIDEVGTQRVVSYENVERIILHLCKTRNVSKVTFDQFNSEATIQRLHSEGISTEQNSCTGPSQLTYFTLFRDLLGQGLIVLPRDSLWTSTLVTQLSDLIVKPNGKMEHGDSGKDLADAVVNSVYTCYKHLVSTGVCLGTGITVGKVSSSLLTNLNKHRSGPTSLGVGKAISTLYKTRKF